jgi:hypothetical protein
MLGRGVLGRSGASATAQAVAGRRGSSGGMALKAVCGRAPWRARLVPRRRRGAPSKTRSGAARTVRGRAHLSDVGVSGAAVPALGGSGAADGRQWRSEHVRARSSALRARCQRREEEGGERKRIERERERSTC